MQRFIKLHEEKSQKNLQRPQHVNLFKTVTSKQIQKKVIENDENLQPNQDQLTQEIPQFNPPTQLIPTLPL